MTTPGPVLGPCTAWIDGADIAACHPEAVGTDTALLDDVAIEASMVLYEVSGRRFSGLCESQPVRPCRAACSCWALSYAAGTTPWYWSSWWGAGGGGWGWQNECGDRMGCHPLSRVKLNGYPVREIVEVKIGGVVLDPLDDNGNPNYRLDGWRWLVRLDDPGPPVVRRSWPGCQNMALDDTELGTFSVTYRYGIDPPPVATRAAIQLGWQLWLLCSGQDCLLPTGVTEVTRAGIKARVELLANWFDPSKPSGLDAVDIFLRAYWRTRAGRRPAVWSPDTEKYARPVG